MDGRIGNVSQAVWLGQSLGSWKMWAQLQSDERSSGSSFTCGIIQPLRYEVPRSLIWLWLFSRWQIIHFSSLASLISCFCFSYPLVLCWFFFFFLHRQLYCEGSLGQREAHFLGFCNRQDPLADKPRQPLPSTSFQSLLSKTCFLETIFSYVCVQSTFKGFRERNVRPLLR